MQLFAIDWTSCCLLAADDPAAQPGPSGFGMMPALVIIMVLFYFLMIRPERRKQASHRSLLESLKKNDRVVTIGGIYGVVTNVHREADEVTIKVDESTNAKLRVTFNAIARVVAEQSPDDKPATA